MRSDYEQIFNLKLHSSVILKSYLTKKSLRCPGNCLGRIPRRGIESDLFSTSLPFSSVTLDLSVSFLKLDSELEDTKFEPNVGRFAKIRLS